MSVNYAVTFVLQRSEISMKPKKVSTYNGEKEEWEETVSPELPKYQILYIGNCDYLKETNLFDEFNYFKCPNEEMLDALGMVKESDSDNKILSFSDIETTIKGHEENKENLQKELDKFSKLLPLSSSLEIYNELLDLISTYESGIKESQNAIENLVRFKHFWIGMMDSFLIKSYNDDKLICMIDRG